MTKSKSSSDHQDQKGEALFSLSPKSFQGEDNGSGENQKREDFLWEIGCEDIPAHMQEKAQKELGALAERYANIHGLDHHHLKTFVSAKRLALLMEKIIQKPFQEERRKGPLVSLGEAAFEGFCRTAGVTKEECYVQETPKGPVWHALISPQIISLPQALERMMSDILTAFSWPKRMRWSPGEHFSWIRPIRWMVALLGTKVVPFSFQKITADRLTKVSLGAESQWAPIPDGKNYESLLQHHGIFIDFQARAERIAESALTLARKEKATLCQEGLEQLVRENAGLAESPFSLLGSFEKEFLSLPSILIATALKVHQKSFCLEDSSKKLIPHFVTITEGDFSLLPQVRQGYERVVKARLSDALFFWQQDKRKPLVDFLHPLYERDFFQELGSMGQKIERHKETVKWLAQENQLTQEEADLVQQVALLAKADLSSAMVNEFPELQGTMGKLYALEQGFSKDLAQSLEDVYSFHKIDLKEGPKERTIWAAYTVVAESLDTLVGFFALDKRPTGSKDPMALRRTAHALIRAIFSFNLRFDVIKAITQSLHLYHQQNLLSSVENLTSLPLFLKERWDYLIKEDLGLSEKGLKASWKSTVCIKEDKHERGVQKTNPHAIVKNSKNDEITFWDICSTSQTALDLDHFLRKCPAFLGACHRVTSLLQSFGQEEKLPEEKQIQWHQKNAWHSKTKVKKGENKIDNPPFGQSFLSFLQPLKKALDHPKEVDLIHLLCSWVSRAQSLDTLDLKENPVHDAFLSPWTQCLNAFLDEVHINDPLKQPQRIALLHGCLDFLDTLGPVALLTPSL